MYATEDVLDSSASIHCPRLEMASRSKLSCVCWNSYIKHLLLAADYDGCLSLWDAQGNVCTGNFDDHGKRVWSADFSTVRTRKSTCQMSATVSTRGGDLTLSMVYHDFAACLCGVPMATSASVTLTAMASVPEVQTSLSTAINPLTYHVLCLFSLPVMRCVLCRLTQHVLCLAETTVRMPAGAAERSA